MIKKYLALSYMLFFAKKNAFLYQIICLNVNFSIFYTKIFSVIFLVDESDKTLNNISQM